MQIVVNTRLLLKDKLDGIGWFSYQTLKQICQRNPKVHFVFLFDRAFDEEFIFSDNITPIVLSPQARHPFLYYTWFQFSVKSTLDRLRPDLFLSPDGFLTIGAKCRQLPVIHDINFLHHPEDSKWLTSRYYNHFFPRYAKEATRIATVSEFSKKDIADNYHINPDKIDVVYNGIHSFFKHVSEADKHLTRLKYARGKNYFVSVGSLHPRKNIAHLVKGFAAFKKKTHSDFKLVLAGPNFWGLAEIHNVVAEEGMKDEVIFTGRLEDHELALVLGSAAALTFIPYYEGFGIPLVEAMEAGVPILTSNVTSLPEVASNAALYADPFDTEQIKNAMVELTYNETLRRDLIKKGSLRKYNFSWEKTSNLLWESVLKTINGKV